MSARIVVTGMGAVTPYGVGLDPLVAGLRERRPAYGALREPAVATWPVQVGGWVPELAPDQLGVIHNKLRGMGKYVRIGVLAAQQALTAAGWVPGSYDPDRAGAFIATGTNGHNAEGLFPAFAVSAGEDGQLDLARLTTDGLDRIHPWWLLTAISNNLIFFITHFLQVRGPNTNLCQAAVAGAYALDRAIEALTRDEIDLALVGGADTPVNWQMMSDLFTLGFLASGPPAEVLPWQPWGGAGRGAILSDGAAFLVLETEARARARGASPLAVVEAVALTATGADDLAPAEDGAAIARVVGELLAELPGEEPLAICGAGVGLARWDAAERRGLAQALGSRAHRLYGAKTWLGHAFSASFPLEMVVAILDLQQGLGLTHPEADESRKADLVHRVLVLGQCFGENTAGVRLLVG
ncbi:MAG: 3-oxoacyl-[acyl-carrier-protein] synthase, KASII [Candidatus Ozemobacter sibiricus]|uniref:3-oxoacyl-[acyl-carrier-protein] synthase, KASII n=1 Tax=Candidatus Ozemobacter sibiricus TaxID=2268124 RepID=A0A367ZT95_9BACT|nr:MAG: 3-oxoacyl-[acyl-carrier-protein] synthase, KASII [Candidatus Ozemobacter sibiricus]